MQWITSLAQVNQSKAHHVIVLIILVFLEVKCDSNMVGYHYIYDILGANYGMLGQIIVPSNIPLLSINLHASNTSPTSQHVPTLLKVVWCHIIGGI